MTQTQAYVLVLTVVSAVFLSTFFISTSLPTGFVIREQLNIGIGDVKTFQSEAIVSWTTTKEATSTLIIDSKKSDFEASTHFSHIVSDLDPGTKYYFIISACDAESCTEKQSSLTTQDQIKTSPITGAIIGGQGTNRILRTAANYVFIVLLGLITVVVAGRFGYEQISNRNPIQGLIKKAETHLNEEEYTEAYDIYTKARQAFMQLEEEAKVKHYDRLLGIYQMLKRYSIIKEAQALTEKYDAGTISREELRRLDDLLST